MASAVQELVTPRQVAQAAGVNVQTIYRKLEAGEIPDARRIGERWIIPFRSAKKWLEGYERYSHTAPRRPRRK